MHFAKNNFADLHSFWICCFYCFKLIKMTTIRPFEPNDLFRFNNYGLPFYMQYLITWPEFFQVAEHPNGRIMGYIMGKAEGRGQEWHGHVTAVTVAAEFRRMGLAAKFMKLLEETSEEKHCYFVDLFVRVSNRTAIKMYENLGYTVFRQITDYYSATEGKTDEDAYDMRKALSWDVEKKSIIPLKTPVHFSEVEEP